MLYCLMDNHSRTSTELAVVADVSPSTGSVHLNRLRAERLVKVQVQGKHRYYCLEGPEVAKVLEALSVLAGGSRTKFIPSTPSRLRSARTCYDHLAGALGVSLHDQFRTLGWLASGPEPVGENESYDLTPNGVKAVDHLGVDLSATRLARRQFAFPCLDWSERRCHIGGALGAALLKLALQKRWVTQDLDSRALGLTNVGRREILARFGLKL